MAASDGISSRSTQRAVAIDDIGDLVAERSASRTPLAVADSLAATIGAKTVPFTVSDDAQCLDLDLRPRPQIRQPGPIGSQPSLAQS